MALSLPRSFKPAAIVVAAAYTALTFGAAITPSPAQAASVPFYRAELTAPVTDGKARPIASGLVWKCAESACTAGEASSRPAIVCARLAKEVGPLTSFSAGGKALEAEDLARCNGK
ncbi:MAG: CC_3452 family protein [Tsuneonella sp.]